MRLAIVVTPENPVPPIGYGGGERVANTMVRDLMKRGHEVDLYAGPGSTCPATRRFLAPTPTMGAEVELAQMIAPNLAAYDCIIDRAAFHIVARSNTLGNVLGLMCGDPFKKYPHDKVQNRVYVSQKFAEFCRCPDHPILPNPLTEDPAAVPLGRGGEHALFVGPIHPMKGIHLAAMACDELGLPFKVYGPIRDGGYAAKLESFRSYQYCGVLERDGREKVFGRARVFLHCAVVCDADPGAPKEAMLRGTPVVCSSRGGLFSRIIPFTNGFYADDLDTLKSAILATEKMDRQGVRSTIIDLASPEPYGTALEALCDRIRQGDRWDYVWAE